MLTPQLLDRGYRVTVYDILYYGGDFLPKDNPNLNIIQGDIRDAAHLTEALEGIEAVLHLACISNDASFVLDEDLSTSVNLDAFEPMVVAAKEAGVKRFVYMSTSSVYGVSDAPDITEEHPLVPLTLYNKYKGMCEPLLFKHTDENFYRRRVPARHRLRVRAASASRRFGEHPHQSRRQQGQDYRLRRVAIAPQPAYPGLCRPLPRCFSKRRKRNSPTIFSIAASRT